MQLPLLRDVVRTSHTNARITLRGLFIQKVLGINRQAYWPVHFTSRVSSADRIRIGIGTAPGLSPGCYIQGANGIEIGDYTLIGPGVGIISSSHSVYDIYSHEASGPIRIGRYCWLGMNSVILPGVELGDHTVVAAGAVVTESFGEGYGVLAGVPAKCVKRLDKSKVIERTYEWEYVGFHYLGSRSKEILFRRLGIRGA